MKGLISVRLEGGIGDHILGMRLLPFIRRRYPKHKIIAYSDCGGHPFPLAIARMSAYLYKVYPVYHKKRFPKVTTWGSMENIREKDIKRMLDADLFFDAWSAKFFIDASKILNVSFYEILSQRPELVIPEEAKLKAEEFLKPYKKNIFIGLNVSKFSLDFLKQNKKIVLRFLKELLKNPSVIILNFYTSSYKFPHWPKALAMDREEFAQKEYLKIGQLWNIDRRVIPVVDFPISVVAGLIKKCRYFIGVDNGLKHLAWALGIPHTFFIPQDLTKNYHFILRWMPDFHHHLLFNAQEEDFLTHLKEAKEAVNLSL